MSSESNSDFTGDDTNLPKSKLAFDFKVVERPIYIPNSGPPLQPISLIPPHKLKGIILDCIPYPKPKDPSHFLVGYENEPHNQLIIHPNNIRNYVSEYTLENWEHERSTAEENRAIEELQPRLIAAEKARRLRELKKAGLSRDVLKGENPEQYEALGMPRKRGRPPKSMASVFKPVPKPLPDLPGGKRRPGRPRKVVEVHVNPPSTSHHQQPSLSQPSLSQPSLSQSFPTASRAMLEHAVVDSESEGEDDNPDHAVVLQLNNEANQTSSSVMNSSTISRGSSPIMRASGQDQINKSPIQSPQKSKSFKKSPHDRVQRAPILPGMSVDAYPYKSSNTDAHNQNKSLRNQESSSLQHLPIPSVENGQSTGHTFPGTRRKSQSKIIDHFKDTDTTSPALKILEANRYQPSSSLKRKSTDQEGESSGKSRTKSRRLDDYLDADYKAPLKRGIELAMDNRTPSFDPSSSTRRESDAFNLRSSRSRSRRLESSPDNEVEEENEHVDGYEGEEGDEEEEEEAVYDSEPPIWAVKSILDHKYEWNENNDKQVLWYFVDWEGDWDPSWEPATQVSKGAVDAYNASRQANGLGDLSVSIDAVDIGENGGGLARGDSLERSIDGDAF
ncbi:hypothetical protein NHQ30_007379 [Ciborinia camelliae]|nr:hypothetical protein NHQ30_007379 [Ciborinia camelliae]